MDFGTGLGEPGFPAPAQAGAPLLALGLLREWQAAPAILHSCFPLAMLHPTKPFNENHRAQGPHKRYPGVVAVIKPSQKP